MNTQAQPIHNTPSDRSNATQRERRFRSHALIEVKKHRFLPLSSKSGVLLDMSLSGVKLDLTEHANITPGTFLWLTIPLSPLGIAAPKKLVCRIECKWYDANKFRLGGVFGQLSNTDRLIIDQIMMQLAENS